MPFYEDYFDLQLRFAARYAELVGLSLTEAIDRCTNLRRRFGLWGAAGDERWNGFLRRVAGHATHQDILRVAITMHECRSSSMPSPFGCFTYESPDSQGILRLHFMPDERHRQASPLAESCLPERRAELRALVMEVRRLHPGLRRVRGISWLYHVQAYRNLFPPTYAASVQPTTEALKLTGSSTWGQVLDYRHRLRPGIADRVLSVLGPSTAHAPWLAFPCQPLSAVGPAEDFFAWFA
ncbi:hypothetical protein JJB11_13950 [Ramlibacter ginsenosidimutans]|uniref:Uncharacterized protein n=1 Tax=Ramlibacter ginsenosidimutans TaxID=502333 RepID=A0A934TTE3_9BURK|nr:hypothetical protein [Ramlibacter ginsenosidimutans]MBK6007199.1 hypothetical protein [Ramlibacter ginsenosidimutans]